MIEVLGIIMTLIIAAYAIRSWIARRRDGLLWALTIAAEKGMPLAHAVAAFAGQFRDPYRASLMQLAHRLDGGLPLPQALEGSKWLVPNEAMVAIRTGWQYGRLGQALREVIVARTLRRPLWHATLGRLAYLVTVLLVIQTVSSFVMVFIIPKFKKIFLDFGIELPEVTQHVLRVGDATFGGGLLLLAGVLEVGVFVYIMVAWLGWGERAIPFLDRLLRRFDSASILRGLALGVECEQPMSANLGLLAGWYPKAGVAARLDSAARHVSAGMNWTESLRHEGLIDRTDAALLASAERVGNLAWALRETADSGERRLHYRLHAWSQLLFPLAVIGVAVVVGLLAVGYFLPLIKLISELSG